MAVGLSGGVIAATAQKYTGVGYTYGGNASTPGDWDCSSFVSYVLGHDLGLTLPGGGGFGSPGYPPGAHGPVVVDYANWPGAPPVGVPQAGDLCVWPGIGTAGHIGIAISDTEMVSALNHTKGTVRTQIQGMGPPGVPLVYRRVSGVAGVVPALVSGTNPVAAILIAFGAIAGTLLLTVAGAGVAGVLVWKGLQRTVRSD